MKPIPVLGIPHYNRPDLTARCIQSIDYPVDVLVLVINNAQLDSGDLRLIQDAAARNPVIKYADLVFHPNAGVAGAWNEIVKLFPGGIGPGKHWWLIANNDITFAAGDLEKMVAAVHQEWLPGHPAPQFFYGNHGASWFALTGACLNLVGLWDENFYPAYLEDCDYAYRMKLLAVPVLTVLELASVHGDGNLTGSCTIHSEPELLRQNALTHSRNFEYYRAKWGGNNGEEKFLTPYNQAGLPLWAWHYDPFFRKHNQWTEK